MYYSLCLIILLKWIKKILSIINISPFVILLFYPLIFLCVSICRPMCVVLVLLLLLLLLLLMMLVLAVVSNFDKAFINSCKRREYSLESQLLN